jgi:hypothetical protein
MNFRGVAYIISLICAILTYIFASEEPRAFFAMSVFFLTLYLLNYGEEDDES